MPPDRQPPRHSGSFPADQRAGGWLNAFKRAGMEMWKHASKAVVAALAVAGALWLFANMVTMAWALFRAPSEISTLKQNDTRQDKLLDSLHKRVGPLEMEGAAIFAVLCNRMMTDEERRANAERCTTAWRKAGLQLDMRIPPQ